MTQAQFPAAARTAGAMIGWWCDRLLGYRPEPLYGVATSFLQQNATANEVIDLGTDDWDTSNLKKHYTQRRLRTAVGMCKGRAITEASGRITPETAAAVAATGVDQIAVGWLTHSARVLDIGLDAG